MDLEPAVPAQLAAWISRLASADAPKATQEMADALLALYNTIHHFGGLIVSPGYTDPAVYAGGGNPYGTSFVSGHTVTGPDEEALALARYQGQRLARYAAVVGAARRAGTFDVKRPRPEAFRGAGLR